MGVHSQPQRINFSIFPQISTLDFCPKSASEKKEAFDNQIMQKILPRIQGSSESTAYILRELFKICAGSFINNNEQTDGLKMKSYLDNKGIADYPKSAEKICKMLRRYEDDDFTSFWV